jgi:hypothetical protein
MLRILPKNSNFNVLKLEEDWEHEKINKIKIKVAASYH